MCVVRTLFKDKVLVGIYRCRGMYTCRVCIGRTIETALVQGICRWVGASMGLRAWMQRVAPRPPDRRRQRRTSPPLPPRPRWKRSRPPHCYNCHHLFNLQLKKTQSYCQSTLSSLPQRVRVVYAVTMPVTMPLNHNYVGHDYKGHNYFGHAYIRHDCRKLCRS